jgi:membrane protein
MTALARLLAAVLVGKAYRERRRRRAAGSPPARAGAPLGAGGGTGGRARGPGTEGSPTRAPESPDTPLDLEAPDWRATLKRTLKEIKDDRVPLVAAGMAYYFFLAIVPAFIALVGILGLANIDAKSLIDSITSSLPQGVSGVLAQPLAQAETGSKGGSLLSAIIGIGVALWSASSGMVALQAGLNVAYDVPRDRKFIAKRGVALLLIVATGLLGLFPSPFFTFGESLIFKVMGWVLSAVAIVIMFSLFYYVAPNRESPRWQWASTGGIVGAVLWIAVAVGFGFYLEALGGQGKYAETYGALAGPIVLILLMFLSSLAVLIGGELNAELERQAQYKTR